MKQKDVIPTDEGKYRLLVESISDYAIYLLDVNGTVTSWNAGAERFKGYSASEIIGRDFSRFYTEEDRAAGLPRKVLQTAAREGKFEGEGWRLRKDGTRFWAGVVVDAIRSPEGELLGFAKITRDLTERRQAEEQLRRSQEQFALLVQSVTDYAIYMLNADGTVASWNAGAERLKGYKPDEIIGRHFSLFYTPEDREIRAYERALATAASEGKFEAEAWRVRKDGTRFFAHVLIDPIRDPDGVLIGFAKITRDVTDRARNEAELQHAREVLMQTQKMDAIGQLTGGVAHDFNNLLMAITSSLALARKRVKDEVVLRSLDTAIEGARRGATLTQRMLAFARKQDLVLHPVDLIELVRGMTELLDRSLDPDITIETRFPLSIKPVLADLNQLELAVLNLCVNARDAMPGGGTITISARQLALHAGEHSLAPGNYICLSIHDTGSGMDRETLARATEPFFTTKGVGKGTGMGLSMVHGVAEQLHGRLVLRSEPDEGTTAEIYLPVYENEEAAAPVAAPAEIARAAERMAAYTILAVDDDPLVLMTTAAMLEDLGHKVYEANSASEALNILATGVKIDVVVTDQAMPQVTGLELAAEIGKLQPDLPVIIATGYAELSLNTLDLPLLNKPFDQDDVSRAISLAMAQKLS